MSLRLTLRSHVGGLTISKFSLATALSNGVAWPRSWESTPTLGLLTGMRVVCFPITPYTPPTEWGFASRARRVEQGPNEARKECRIPLVQQADVDKCLDSLLALPADSLLSISGDGTNSTMSLGMGDLTAEESSRTVVAYMRLNGYFSARFVSTLLMSEWISRFAAWWSVLRWEFWFIEI
ncbi:hypothetical protein HOY82DRAFT_673470 [Tuber indicum]|nr:hypothetical protein HOY82DRAFT_673470 [Tuber indicum]